MQPLLGLDKLWSWASTSVGGLPVAIVLPVFQLSFHNCVYGEILTNLGVYAPLAPNYEL